MSTTNLKALILSALFFSFGCFANTTQTFQERFERGVATMGTNPSLAAEIFADLYEDTKAIRVQLEWARALYLAGKLDEAKKQFVDILNKPDEIPITVRDKVEWYVNDIQKRDGLKFYFSVFQDTNPGYITSTRTVTIFGQQLTYQPVASTKPEMALNVGLQGEKEIIEGSQFFAQLGANTLTYQTSAFNKQTLDASLSKRWMGADYKDVKLGMESMFYGGYSYYNYPYISTRFIYNGPNQDYYGFYARGGTIDYPTYTYLSGNQATGNVFLNHNITHNISAYFETGGDRTTATQQAYSSYGMYLTLGTQLSEDSSNIQATLKASILQRNYWDSDPFWGQVRKDTGNVYYLGITKRNLYIFGLRPVIDMTYQTNNSTIPFFTYNKYFGGISFTNVY